MKLVIDTEKIDNDIGVDGLLYLTSLSLGYPINGDTFKKLNDKGLIFTESMKDGFPYDVRSTKDSEELVEGAYADMEISGRTNDDRFSILADKLRELYPTGRKSGTQLQWRDSTAVIAKRLKAFVKRFGVDFTDDEYIAATKRYIQTFNGNYQYMQVLKYFIMKSGVEDGMSITNSQLLSYLQNEDTDAEGDWTSQLK